MTTVAALFGALPLMLGSGTGSELRHPLGISIVGGLLVSQLLTLFTTPVIYIYFDRLGRRMRGEATAAQARRHELLRHLHPPARSRRRLLTLGLALAGGVAYLPAAGRAAAQRRHPDDLRSRRRWPGASPETMSTSVATPLERHLGVIADVDRDDVDELGRRDAHHAAVQPRAATSTARRATCRRRSTRRAPICRPRCASNPTYRKINPADQPVLILALTSDTLTPGQIYDSASTILQQKLSQVDGIGQVQIGGSSLPAVRVELNPRALFKYGIGLEDVRAALSAANANAPKGAVEQGASALPDLCQRHRDTGRPSTSTLIVAYRNGAAVRLADVAERQRQRRGRAQYRHGERQAGGPGHPVPPARRQHHRDRRQREGDAAANCRPRSRPRSSSRSPTTAPPRSAPRCAMCETHDDDLDPARHARGLSLPAQRPRRADARASRCRCR